MIDPNGNEIIIAHPYKKYIPWLTALCSLVSVVLFVGINLDGKFDWDAYRKWGAPSANDIWNGSYWGLISTNFLHVEIWHLAFNLYWFWIFGKKIEFESSKLFFGLFILSSSLISSLGELAFAGTSGIGLSGVAYAMFGYIFIKGKLTSAYANFIDKRTTLWFIIWLVLCIILSYSKVWQVGNAAHAAGLLWGLLIGRLTTRKIVVQFYISLAVLGIVAATVFWAPWCPEWLLNNAYNLHKEQKLDDAKIMYKKVLAIDKDNAPALQNLTLLQIDSISRAAYSAHAKGDYEKAHALYNGILKIDPGNKWAKENDSLLQLAYKLSKTDTIANPIGH